MATNGKKGQKLAKAAMAKTNNISYTVEGAYENDRQRFQALSQDLGVTYDSNNNVVANAVKSDTAANTAHAETISGNPHNVTADDVGLGGGYTGTIEVVTSVDFVGETTTTSTITITNGIITGVA